MTLLLPLGLALGALVPALILLYVLKTRHQEHEVSSTFLWERLLRDLAAREPFQRLRWSVLLLLQLLALVALVLAVARPALTLTAPQPVHAVLVFDTSASMQATDVPPSRFDDARERARAVVEGLPGGSRVTVITAGRQVLVPAVNVEAWRALQVLDELKPSGGKANLQVAVDLARALAGSQSAGVSPGAVAGEAAAAPSSPIYLFTDGAAGESLDTAGVEVVLSGDSTPNVGIVQLSARSLPDDPNRHQVFVQVHNAAATPQARTLEILADGAVMESTRLTIEPDGDGSHVFEVSAGEATLVEVRLT
ncbi:MAG TPA: VWA domain-containing protein, partial [Chloroflexota bacterium]